MIGFWADFRSEKMRVLDVMRQMLIKWLLNFVSALVKCHKSTFFVVAAFLLEKAYMLINHSVSNHKFVGDKSCQQLH